MTRININRDWQFFRGDMNGAESPAFDDRDWDRIGLPHSFDHPYFRTPEFYVGYGWYRRRFDVPRDWIGKKLFLQFEAAFQDAEVFVNGKFIGRHVGGYTSFEFDVTDAISPGSNLISVRVNNNWSPIIAPRAGEHIFCGGIYRDVYLAVKNPVHIPWRGSSVTTPKVSRESGIVNVKTPVRNDGPAAKRCRVVSTIIGPVGAGQIIATMEEQRPIPPGHSLEFDQTSEAIGDILLWHTDHPHVYTVRTEVFDGQDLVDSVTVPFGFRWFEWTADRGFFLNGEHLYLRGVNAHQDHSGWGIAITPSACWRDVRLIKEAGFNFIRGAHYPHHPAFADACDRLGLIFWSENCFWGKGGFGPEGYWNASAFPINPDHVKPFAESCRQSLREMIRDNRNHPSIMVWSMTNEAFFTFNLDAARELMADLVKLSRELDPTRPAAIGGSQRGNVDKLGDIAGYNGDGARLFIDPGVPNMVSEYGAISKPPDAYEPFFGELQIERFPWRAGQAIWAGFDYGSIAGKQGLKGILRHDRLPKRSWYWYRNEYRHLPPPPWAKSGTAAKLRLSGTGVPPVSSSDERTHGRDAHATDIQIIVTVLDAADHHISNCPVVTLTIESGPGEFPTGNSITFDPATDIAIIDGQAAIAMRSYHGGQTIIRATSPGLEDATLTITTDFDPPFIPGVTPPAKARPYNPPPPSQASIEAMKNAVNVARDRPSRASSEAPGHPARFANDADPSTFWQASDPGGGAWLLIDLEGFYQLSDSRLTFSQPGNFRYVVDTSRDHKRWKREIDRSQTIRTDASRHDVFDPGTIARYVRVTIVGVPAGAGANLAEVEVHGILSVR